MANNSMTWEDAVQWLKTQPEQRDLVLACYYDDPLIDAARRYAASEEWLAVRSLLSHRRGTALDLGAGRGISSFALAQAGWEVTALEPDPSATVGAGAIRQLAYEALLPIHVVEEYAEKLPFNDNTFDLVYGRQVLHHARDLETFCAEAARVLKPGGCFVATREHVIDSPADLAIFLDQHPLHKLYGGEHAYELTEYTQAIAKAGLKKIKIIPPFESPINYSPLTRQQLSANPLSRVVGKPISQVITDERHPIGKLSTSIICALLARFSHNPGRVYSFIAERP